MAESSGQKISQFYLDDIWQVFGRRKRKNFCCIKAKIELLTFGGGKKPFLRRVKNQRKHRRRQNVKNGI
jgi:hypothetical protein